MENTVIRANKNSQQYEPSLPIILENQPRVLSEGIYTKGETVGEFKIISEGKVYAKHVIYNVVAVKDVPFKKVKLRLR